MSAHKHLIDALAAWTPYLAVGFLWNISIAFVAMSIGSATGYGLAKLRVSGHPALSGAGNALSALMRNTPTLVFQFYLLFMLPGNLPLPFTSCALPFPAWLKAALALSLAVSGFVSDNLLSMLSTVSKEKKQEFLLFMSAWGSYFAIIVMASSTASVIGVAELVSRCNTMILALGSSDDIPWIYLYAMSWFFIFCLAANTLLEKVVAASLAARRRNAASEAQQ